jgi:hypothetical protein
MKKLLLVTGLLVLATAVFAEEVASKIEQVTYYDFATQSMKTVNAVFTGWQKTYWCQVGGYMEKFSSIKFEYPIETDWSEYAKVGSMSSRGFGLRDLYNEFVRLYQSGKHVGTLQSMPSANDETNVLVVEAILPGSGNSSPYWWSLDGKLLYVSNKTYLVMSK